MEVCVDCVESALNAAKGGAMRLELCSALSEDGLTPSVGALRVIKSLVNIPVFVMLRPRKGSDFVYSPSEIEAMKIDARVLKENGADGFVFGILTPEGNIDGRVCKEILDIVAPLPATFHRAFDVCTDLFSSLDMLVQLGFRRVLTSGGDKTVELGASFIKELIAKADSKIIVMPGGGITNKNVAHILAVTGAKEFHGSARNTDDDKKISFLTTNAELVGSMVGIASEIIAQH